MATAVATQGSKAKRDIPFSWTGMDKKGNRIRKQSQAFKSGGKVKAEDIAVFARQLATMLASGIPLVQAFEIVGTGNDKPAMQKLVLDVKSDIEGGTAL